jgi:ABC-type amino acid transport substrate-binding protein
MWPQTLALALLFAGVTCKVNLKALMVPNNANGTATGFMPDLLDQVAQAGDFTYTLAFQKDRVFGVQLPDGSWSGMIGQLIAGNCDLIAADLTITNARNRVIDFTTPWHSSSLRILVNSQTGLKNVKYLVRTQTSAYEFLAKSDKPKVKAIWSNIVQNNGTVQHDADAVNLVLQGGYAYIGDEGNLQQSIKKNPGKLALDTAVLLTQFLAYGVQKGSPNRDLVSLAIEKLTESGDLERLIDKYSG